MSDDVTLVVGDRLPLLQRTISIDANPVNLTGYTVTFDMWNATTSVQVITNGPATIVNAVGGVVQYAWTAADALLPAGTYFGKFKATAAGLTLHAPNVGNIVVHIYSTTGGWTYGYDPSARPVDAVRYLTGDTDPNAKLLSDGEIAWLLTENGGNVYLAAAQGCEGIASTTSSNLTPSSKSVGGLSISYSTETTVATAWSERAQSLRAMSINRYPPRPNYYIDDDGHVGHKSKFTVGMDDNRGT